jgi:hypothetical protein
MEAIDRRKIDRQPGNDRRSMVYYMLKRALRERVNMLLVLLPNQWWANLDQASKDLDKTIFRDLSPTPIP